MSKRKTPSKKSTSTAIVALDTLDAPPAHLSDRAKAVWIELGHRFVSAGVVAPQDAPAFSILCQSYAAWSELIELAKVDGPVVRVNGVPSPNPYLQRADKEAARVVSLLKEFGATPVSRARAEPTPGAWDGYGRGLTVRRKSRDGWT